MEIDLIQHEEIENTLINLGDLVPAEQITEVVNANGLNVDLRNYNLDPRLLINLGELAPAAEITSIYNQYA